jgi:hypothetical protein
MKLARMLMVSKDSGCSAIDVLGHEQEGPDALICFHSVFDSLSHIRATIGRFQENSVKRTPNWKRAKKFLQVIAMHDLSIRPNVILSMPLSVLSPAVWLVDRSSPTAPRDRDDLPEQLFEKQLFGNLPPTQPIRNPYGSSSVSQ